MKNITRQEALNIANKNMKESYFEEELKNDWLYILIGFNLECEDITDKGREAYLISVVGGTYSAQRPDGYVKKGNSIFDKMKEIFGEFSRSSNIKCIVYKDNGEYKYLREEIWNDNSEYSYLREE